MHSEDKECALNTSYVQGGVLGATIYNIEQNSTVSRWTEKQTVVHPDNGILFNPKNKWLIKPYEDIEKSKMHTTK